MKYGTWKVGLPEEERVAVLRRAGFSPLTAMALCARGLTQPEKAQELLRTDAPLIDPFQLKEMDRAVKVIRQALAERQRIAIFGDYDVDGITATCLLTDYLRGLGADCLCHIPSRMAEGYGLNAQAIEELAEHGVGLIITVDCGITAVEEARLCAQKGIQLVITDHHECKEVLPQADAVVDPHRPDRTYPHTDLCGVGVAFKLAAALSGDQAAMARRYCDLFCLGTIADVMPLSGENRRLVVQGLAALQNPQRVGLRALMAACGCAEQSVNAATVGYVLAPRINAAGRMERAELAVRLFLTKNPAEALHLAETLCRLNRERQATEQEIYQQATAMLRQRKQPESAIVLAGENWHQGVVGIVASRLSEEYGRPAFLICLTGDRGKASSRSYGGFNLFGSLSELSELLDGYGGHELAAGFTIDRNRIDEFRRRVCQQAEQFFSAGEVRSVLEADCEVPPEMLTLENVEGLSQLEPCGTGCPRPVFVMSEVIIQSLGTVGSGKHLRLKLQSRDGTVLQAIYFSAGKLTQTLREGDRVDVAFHAQVNEFRGNRSVQLSLLDLRPVEAERLYARFLAQRSLSAHERRLLAPERADVARVWNYLCAQMPGNDWLDGELESLCHGVSAAYELQSLRRTHACLDILRELGLIELELNEGHFRLRIFANIRNPLENSSLYHTLRGDTNGKLSGAL